MSADKTTTEKAESINTKGGVVLILCIITGLIGGHLFNVSGLALNLSIFALLIGLCYYFIYNPKLSSRKNWLLVPFGLYFILAFSWHDSSPLFILNIMGLFLVFTVGLAVDIYDNGFKLEFKKTTKVIAKMIAYGLSSPVRFVASDIKKLRTAGATASIVPKIMRGLFLSIPVIIVFGVLLGSADLRYLKFIETSFSWDQDTFKYLFISFISFAIAVWFLRGKFKASFPEVAESSTEEMRASAIEVTTVLAAVNFLFLSFIVIQLGYFFGNDALVMQEKGITYAVYAKQGFFELVTIALIALPLLWLLEWLVRDASSGEKTAFRIVTLITLVLVSLIAASAIHRLSLYTEAYGLTEIRLYSNAFLYWILALFVIFIFTVLRGKRDYFLANVLLSFMLMVLTLNLLNPNALIAKTNINRTFADTGAASSIDLTYLFSLGNDVVPTLVKLLKEADSKKISGIDKTRIRCWISTSSAFTMNNWRVWSYSRYKAKRLTTAESINQLAAPESGTDSSICN